MLALEVSRLSAHYFPRCLHRHLNARSVHWEWCLTNMRNNRNVYCIWKEKWLAKAGVSLETSKQGYACRARMAMLDPTTFRMVDHPTRSRLCWAEEELPSHHPRLILPSYFSWTPCWYKDDTRMLKLDVTDGMTLGRIQAFYHNGRVPPNESWHCRMAPGLLGLCKPPRWTLTHRPFLFFLFGTIPGRQHVENMLAVDWEGYPKHPTLSTSLFPKENELRVQRTQCQQLRNRKQNSISN